MSKLLEYITHPYMFFVIGIAILMFGLTRKNNNYFDVRMIVGQYFAMFKDCKAQLTIFLGVPLVFAIGALRISPLNSDVIGNMIIVLSILLSMFFAILTVMTSFTRRDSGYTLLLRETFNTIIFECIMAIITLLVLIVVQFVGAYDDIIVIKVFSFLVYYLMVWVVLNIFIVIKRLKVLFDEMMK